MRAFPQNCKHLNIFCTAIISKFEIGRRLFENFGKFEERSSKFLEIRKSEKFQMNDTKIAIFSHNLTSNLQKPRDLDKKNLNPYEGKLKLFGFKTQPTGSEQLHLLP